LQYGVPLEVYVNKFSHTRFEPMGHTKNPDIRIAKSLVDYIFRWLGITFLPGYREASQGYAPEAPASAADDADAESKPAAKMAGGPATGPTKAKAVAPVPVKPAPSGTNGSVSSGSAPNGTRKAPPINAALLERAGAAMKVDLNGGFNTRTEQFASFQADAPSCDNCGAITVRNGNCYLCHNCGNSMGCS
jgi:ribonucleoside-diphosphate reductase alpha chain